MRRIGAERAYLLVAFAEGCDVIDDMEDWWPIHHAIAGGDDFCWPIRLDAIRYALERAQSDIIMVVGRQRYIVLSDGEFDALNEEDVAQGLALSQRKRVQSGC